MYDGSALSIELNAANTEEIVKACHVFGIPVEAELGELARIDEKHEKTTLTNLVSSESIKEFLQLCHPDFLALGIGNAHGFYYGEPEIRINILEHCRAFTDIPFVLHGCTGMDEKLIQTAISYGVTKINFGTQIRYKYLKYLKEGLEQGADEGHAWKLSQYTVERLKEDIKEIILIAGSADKV